MQQNTCATVCWSTSCNVQHPQKDLGSCYCDTCPTMEQLSSTHQQWFHILLHMETPLWMQCQGSWHCPTWHNCHTTGSNQTPLVSSTTCIATTCTAYAAHTCCTCNTGNPDKPSPSCSYHASCSKECAGTNACNILCQTHAAMKIQPCPHGTKMPNPGNLRTIDLDCPQTLLLQHAATYIPSKLLQLNCCVSYSQKGGCCMIISFSFKDWSLISWSHFAVHIYIYIGFLLLSHMSSGS